MKTNNSVKKLALGVALTSMVAWQASAILAYDFGSAPGNQAPDGTYSLGDVFTVTTPIAVDSLGVIDPGDAAFSGVVDVAIYSISLSGTTITGGSLLTSASVTSGAMQSISPYTLGAGTYMIVANNLGQSGAIADYNPAWDTANGASYPGHPASTGVNQVTANNAYGVTFSPLGYVLTSGPLPSNPSGFNLDNYWTSGGPRFGAGNFDFAPVPEAAGFAVAAVALLGLVYVGRCYSQKIKAA